jgi:hypothetical protein
MSSSILDSVLARMVSSYEEKAVVAAPRKAKAPRQVLTRVVKAKDSVATAPSAVRKITSTIPVAAVGTLDAAGFLLACRDAGKISKRNDRGILVTLTDSNKARTDQIQAIAAFVGYDFGGALGVQLDSARQKAQYILRPVKADSTVAVTVKAFVAGLPDGTAKIVSDLKARIRMATDTMLDNEKIAEQHERDSAEYATHMALAAVESERLGHMRRDLAAIIGE